MVGWMDGCSHTGWVLVSCSVLTLSFQDFGDYQDGYYSVQTTEGEQIAQLIAGYIDIILKKVSASTQPEPS